MFQDPLRKIPGPVSLPLIGNVHLLDPTKMHVQMYEWAEKYGPVMKFSIFNKPYVVLNSLEGCLEAKHHRGKLHLDQIGVTSCRCNKSLHTLRWRPPVTKECLMGQDYLQYSYLVACGRVLDFGRDIPIQQRDRVGKVDVQLYQWADLYYDGNHNRGWEAVGQHNWLLSHTPRTENSLKRIVTVLSSFAGEDFLGRPHFPRYSHILKSDLGFTVRDCYI